MASVPRRRKQPPRINRLYLLYYLSLRSKWILLGFPVAIASLAFLVIRLEYAVLPLFAILGSLGVGLASTGNGLRRVWEELRESNLTRRPFVADSYEKFLEGVRLPEELIGWGYREYEGGLARDIFEGVSYTALTVASPSLNQLLWGTRRDEASALKVEVPRECRRAVFGRTWRYPKWALPVRSKALLAPSLALLSRGRPYLANESKIRLRKDLASTHPLAPVSIERTDYLADLATGQLTGSEFVDQNGHPYYSGYDFPFAQRQGSWFLKSCQDSACSNQIGVSSLAVGISELEDGDGTSLQGHVFLVLQGEGNLQSAGLLGPSGSGSLDWSDYEDAGSQCIEHGMVRELLEETTSGSWGKLVDRGCPRVVLTGFGRMVHRGGKPEFYGMVIMPRRGDERGIDPSEKTYVAGFEQLEIRPLDAQSLALKLEQYAADRASALSHPLFVCIRFALDFLRQRGSEFEAIVAEVANDYRSKPGA